MQVIECQVVDAGSQLSVALEDENQQPWEYSPTHTQPPHIRLPMLHIAWHAVTPPVTIVLLLDAKLQDLGMHMHLLQHLGSQLMPQNVESVYIMFTSEFHWPKEHVNWHIHSLATNPVCVVCVCDVYVWWPHLGVQ